MVKLIKDKEAGSIVRGGSCCSSYYCPPVMENKPVTCGKNPTGAKPSQQSTSSTGGQSTS